MGSKIVENAPEGETPSDLERYCFGSSYLAALVHFGLRYSDQTMIDFVKKVDGVAIDWTIGMLLSTHRQPRKDYVPSGGFSSSILVLGLFSVGVVILYLTVLRRRAYTTAQAGSAEMEAVYKTV